MKAKNYNFKSLHYIPLADKEEPMTKRCCDKWEKFSEIHCCTFVYCPECGKDYTVEEPKEFCMCSHSTKPGAMIMVEDPKKSPLVCLECHKELPFLIFQGKVEEEKSLEEKFNKDIADNYINGAPDKVDISTVCHHLAQIAKEHYQKKFDEAAANRGYDYQLNNDCKYLRKAMFGEEKLDV